MSQNPSQMLNAISMAIARIAPDLSFNIFEVGALPVGEKKEAFYPLLKIFPKSTITAFEVNEKLCEELNAQAPHSITYHPVALGEKNETRQFYETARPMCCSLYKPIDEVSEKFTEMDSIKLKAVSEVQTTSLDSFTTGNNISDVDFIKIDIQGAELDVFRGGTQTLRDVIFIVSEVEFIPIYHDQPLFGDVCKFLAEQDLMFHKNLAINGRTIKGLTINNDPTFVSQHMWSDAVFIRNIFKLTELKPEKLLKMGMLACIYQSPDVAYHCFQIFDEREKTDLAKQLLSI